MGKNEIDRAKLGKKTELKGTTQKGKGQHTSGISLGTSSVKPQGQPVGF